MHICTVYIQTLLVASQYPDLDAGEAEVSDSVRNAVLEFVFNGRGAEKGHIFLNFFEDFIQPIVATHQRSAAQSIHILL